MTKLFRIAAIVAAVLATTSLLNADNAVKEETTAAQRPNIILILADDVGLGDVGCSGGPFKTPHIDALAGGGIRFEYCYATPLCSPSRCQLLTGRCPALGFH